MYGMNMAVKHKGLTVKLRPVSKKDITELVKYFSSMKIHMYTAGIFGQTLENETKWYEKNGDDKDSCVWGIQPAHSKVLIGITALNGINGRDGDCTSGIIIWRKDWWGKGIASAAHLGRTLFAADYLNRCLIRSSVRTMNPGSFKALQKVGYTVWGTEPRSCKRGGKWLDTYHLSWIHPEQLSVLYPEGLPEMYKDGVAKAAIALETARREVTFP